MPTPEGPLTDTERFARRQAEQKRILAQAQTPPVDHLRTLWKTLRPKLVDILNTLDEELKP